MLSPGPVHDWTSHAADAFRYVAAAHLQLRHHVPVYERPWACAESLLARASRFETEEACQRAPRADRMPLSLSARDIASRVLAPELRIASTTGTRPATNSSAAAIWRRFLPSDRMTCWPELLQLQFIDQQRLDEDRALSNEPRSKP